MKLELAYRELVGLDIVDGLCLEQQQACESVRVAVANLRDIGDRNYAVSEYVPCVCEGGGVGRPRFDIPREQLEALIETHFTAPQMAGMLGVSVRSVRRRMSEFNLSIRSQYTELTDRARQDCCRNPSAISNMWKSATARLPCVTRFTCSTESHQRGTKAYRS